MISAHSCTCVFGQEGLGGDFPGSHLPVYAHLTTTLDLCVLLYSINGVIEGCVCVCACVCVHVCVCACMCVCVCVCVCVCAITSNLSRDLIHHIRYHILCLPSPLC